VAYVYVAGSSNELPRVKRFIEAVVARGHTVTHDWPAEVEEVGNANPLDASLKQRRTWASADLHGVAAADLVVVLMPEGAASFGAGVEFGYALERGIPIVVSGQYLKSIFTAFATCYEHDDEVLERLPVITDGPIPDCDCRDCEKRRAQIETTCPLEKLNVN
jgi:hypothetical protein